MKLNVKNLLYNAVMALLLAVMVVNPIFGADAATIVGLGTFAVGCCLPAKPATSQSRFAFMAIQTEIWVEDIAENVVPDNSFIMQSRDDSAGLVGRTVHVGQAGAPPTAQKNRVGAGTISKRVDTVNDYVIDEFTTDPTVVTITEEIEVSYPKRVSVMMDHIDALRTLAAESVAGNWAPTLASNIIYSTGDARAAYKLGHQTGNRLAVAKKDFANASRILNNMDVPQDGRVALVDADLLMDLMSIPEFVSANIFGQAGALKEGILGRVFGFNIMVRSRTSLYTPVGVVKDMAAAKAATDCASILFWHPMFVRRAIGTSTNGGVMVFEQNGSPTHYGDVISAMVRAGGKHHYANQRGVVALVEAVPA
jgi:N4-gp56 family major capsid protein